MEICLNQRLRFFHYSGLILQLSANIFMRLFKHIPHDVVICLGMNTLFE